MFENVQQQQAKPVKADGRLTLDQEKFIVPGKPAVGSLTEKMSGRQR
jgi:hypothetical protein